MQMRPLSLAALAMLAASAALAQTPTFATLYNFHGSPDGAAPHAGVIVGLSGALYGTTYTGGASKFGTVFGLAPPASAGGPWTETILYSFAGTPDGQYPSAGLAFGPSGSTGALFGTTAEGGSGFNGGGAVFQLSPPTPGSAAWTEAVLFSFPHGGHETGIPNGTLLVQPSGAIFGTNHGSCYNSLKYVPSVFLLTPPAVPGGAWTEFTILNLQVPSGGTDGVCPAAGVVELSGVLYGTAYADGEGVVCGYGPGTGCGTVYALATPSAPGGTWTETTIHSFAGPDGAKPQAPVKPGPGGVLYGTTAFGGAGGACSTPEGIGGCGTVFQLTPPTTPGGTWAEAVLYSFTGANGDGQLPAGNLVLAPDGSLYGTTQYGGSSTSGSPCSYDGASGCGTIFQLTPPTVAGGTWTETVLHNFSGKNGEGSVPNGLILGPGGVLYGTTQGGGTHGGGTVFSITP